MIDTGRVYTETVKLWSMSLVQDRAQPTFTEDQSRAKGMSLLFVTSRYPYPLLKGDQVRAHHQIKELVRRGHKIILVTFDNGERNPEFEKLCQAVYVVKPISRSHVISQGFKLLWSDKPLQLAFFQSEAMWTTIQHALEQHEVEGAILQLSRMGQYLPLLNEARIPVVLDLIDSLAMNIDLKAQKATFPINLLWRLEAKRLFAYERSAVASAAAATVVSAKDKAYLGQAAVCVNPNGVTFNENKTRNAASPQRNSETLLFHGNMSYYPNVEAAQFLVCNIMPEVWKRHPHCKVLLVGANPSHSVKELASKNVTVTGFVDEVTPYLQTATLGVYPILRATGIQNKILEAMREKLPVLTTQTVADGLEHGVVKKHFYLAEEASVFANTIVRLLAAASERERLGEAGQTLVLEHYTWEKTVEGLEALLKSAVNKRTVAA